MIPDEDDEDEEDKTQVFTNNSYVHTFHPYTDTQKYFPDKFAQRDILRLIVTCEFPGCPAKVSIKELKVCVCVCMCVCECMHVCDYVCFYVYLISEVRSSANSLHHRHGKLKFGNFFDEANGWIQLRTK